MFLKHLYFKIKKLTKTVIFKNFSSLFILQLGNTALAFLIMPYLINVLGVGNYGLYSFVFSISMYLVILTDYGFGFTGVKLISINRDNKKKINSIFHSIQIIKTIILLIVLFVYTMLVFTIESLSINKELFFLSFGILIGQTVIPVWFFQGMEKMKFITIINLTIRVLAVILILLYVKKPDDIFFAVTAQAISFSFAGILSLYIAYKSFKLNITIPSTKTITQLFLNSKDMFLSNLSLSIYKNFNIILLGFFSNNIEVGIYSAAEKIIKAVQTFIAPLSQAIYPNMSLKFSKLKSKDSLSILLKISTYYFIPLFVIIILLIIFQKKLSALLNVNDYNFSKVFFILLPVIALGSFTYLLGIVGLVNLNKEKWLNRATLVGGVVNVLMCIILSKRYGAIGSSIALLSAELIVLILITKYLIKIRKS